MPELFGRGIFLWYREDAVAAALRAIQPPEQAWPGQLAGDGIAASGPNQRPGLRGFRPYTSQEVLEGSKRSAARTFFGQPLDDGARKRLHLHKPNANGPAVSAVGPIAGVDIGRQDRQPHPPCLGQISK